MGQVYSTRFLFAAAGGTYTYTIPGLKRAVVKSFSGVNLDTVTGQALIYINGSPVLTLNIASNQSAVSPPVMIVFNTGDELKLITTNKLTAQISGYLLDV